MAINLISSQGMDKGRVMHSESDNREIMISDKADEVTEERFEWRINRYQIGLKISMAGSDSIFDFLHLLYCKCEKINFKWGAPYKDSPDWMKRKQQ